MRRRRATGQDGFAAFSASSQAPTCSSSARCGTAASGGEDARALMKPGGAPADAIVTSRVTARPVRQQQQRGTDGVAALRGRGDFPSEHEIAG